MKKLISTLISNRHIHSLLLQIISALLGFFSFIVLARTYDKSTFGHWVIYITAYGFLEVLRYGLTLQGVVRFLSGADESEKKKICAANWMINVSIGLSVALLVFLSAQLFKSSINKSDYYYFFTYYPLLVIASLGSFNSQATLQASQRFDRMLLLRSFEAGTFLIYLIINYLWIRLNLHLTIIIQIIIFLSSSLFCSLKGWDGIRCLRYLDKNFIKKILHFGKYSTGTLIGAHLLKSADTFILGMSSVLGAPAVAIYSVPLKAIEIIEIPLRAFSLTVYPVLSRFSIENKMNEFRNHFYNYTGSLTILFIPLMLTGFIFAKEIVILIGGQGFESGAVILKIFTIFGLITPIDRFTGIALDSLNRPDLNFYKIIFMVTANIIGDLIAVFVFQSMIMVAWVTLAFLIIGSSTGLIFTYRTAGIELFKIFSVGWHFNLNNLKNFFLIIKQK